MKPWRCAPRCGSLLTPQQRAWAPRTVWGCLDVGLQSSTRRPGNSAHPEPPSPPPSAGPRAPFPVFVCPFPSPGLTSGSSPLTHTRPPYPQGPGCLGRGFPAVCPEAPGCLRRRRLHTHCSSLSSSSGAVQPQGPFLPGLPPPPGRRRDFQARAEGSAPSSFLLQPEDPCHSISKKITPRNSLAHLSHLPDGTSRPHR